MIRCGFSRIVLLWDDKVYKVARVKPLILLVWLVWIHLSESKREKFFAEYGTDLCSACFRLLFVGLFANYREYTYSENSNDRSVARVLRCYLGGLVTTQERVAPVSLDEIKKECPCLISRAADLLRPENFGRRISTGEIVVLDYGNLETIAALSAKRH